MESIPEPNLDPPNDTYADCARCDRPRTEDDGFCAECDEPLCRDCIQDVSRVCPSCSRAGKRFADGLFNAMAEGLRAKTK